MNTFPSTYRVGTMDRIPSTNTLKRHPKVDLNKNDLLRLLSYLEGELQARDISIASLKTERARHLLYQAKYGKFGLGDPFLALQRDCSDDQDAAFTESSVKILYENQLLQLENLIETQRRAQIKMQEQISIYERKYHKVQSELEEEKRKHAQDTAQGDDVTYMLEKERGRLKQELEFEKGQRRKLERELKKITGNLEDEKLVSQKHKQVALVLIREKKDLFEKLLLFQERNSFLEKQMQNWSDSKDKTIKEVLTQEKAKLALKMEAALEKQLSDFDIERESLSGRLKKEAEKNHKLLEELSTYEKATFNVGSVLHQPNFSLDSTGPQSLTTQCKSPLGAFNEDRAMPDLSGLNSGASSQGFGSLVSTSGGARISDTSTVRRVSASSRGVPPPVPPNKPQINIPLGGRKDIFASPGEVPGKQDSNSVRCAKKVTLHQNVDSSVNCDMHESLSSNSSIPPMRRDT